VTYALPASEDETRARSLGCGRFLPRLPLTILAAGILLLACAPQAEAQASVSPGNFGLRVDWTANPTSANPTSANPTSGRWQPVCGYLYNDTLTATREVELLVEGRDGLDRVIDSRPTRVLGYVSPRGRTSFCAMAAAGAARYSVTIVAVQWGSDR
jgi:hypothetical protein